MLEVYLRGTRILVDLPWARLGQEIGVSFRVEGSTVSMMGFKFAVEKHASTKQVTMERP